MIISTNRYFIPPCPPEHFIAKTDFVCKEIVTLVQGYQHKQYMRTPLLTALKEVVPVSSSSLDIACLISTGNISNLKECKLRDCYSLEEKLSLGSDISDIVSDSLKDTNN